MSDSEDGGSPGVIVYGYDGLPMHPVAPQSPDYMSSPDHPPSPIYSLGYVTESDLEEDPEEYKDDETEDGPVDYPIDGGDDGDNDDGDSSGDDADDEDKDEDEEDEEDEEEHEALADSAIVVPTVELVSPPKGTDPVIPPPSTNTTTTRARITGSALLASTQSLIDAVTAALPSPPLPLSLPIPLPVDRRDDIPESEMPPCKRSCLSTLESRYKIGESSTAIPTRGRGVDPAEAVHEVAPTTLGEVSARVAELAKLHERDTHDLYALLEDAQDSRSRISQRVAMDSQRVDLLIGDRMTLQETIWIVEDESNVAREARAHAIGLSRAVHHELQTHHDHEYAHGTQIQVHQTQLQLQGTLIQTQHQVHETRSQMQQAEMAELREIDRRCQAQMVETFRVMRDMRREMGDMQAELLSNETEKVNKYIRGLPDNIYGNVKSSKPKTLDETIELANDLIDQKLCTYAERQSDNKRKTDDSPRNNHGEKKPSTGNTNVANAQKGNGATPKGNGCFECGAPGHFKRDCPKLKNKTGGNGNAQGWVYAVGNAEKSGNAPGNPDANVVTGTFLLNNHYASILFDTGADRSFISTAFSSLINIAPTSLENCYDVELADGKLVKMDTVLRGCTLNFLDHPFNVDLMPVELGSFDVIIGMDWLRRYHAVI
ncbi:putative reverse transcriptase domain-containing protein, partial [Tanacetum coccineum]